MKWDISKDPRELGGRLMVVRGGRRSRSNREGAVLEQSIWGDLKFPKDANKVPNSPQQNMPTRTEADRAGTAESQQDVRRGGLAG